MHAQVIEAPSQDISQHSWAVFLSGGITDCPNWQLEIIDKLADLPVTLYNPRRKIFPIHDPSATEEQIIWEYQRLQLSRGIIFWFPKQTVCPIVLFELGRHSDRPTWIWVGMDPEYLRRRDIETQMKLRRPGMELYYSLDDIAGVIRKDVLEWNR